MLCLVCRIAQERRSLSSSYNLGWRSVICALLYVCSLRCAWLWVRPILQYDVVELPEDISDIDSGQFTTVGSHGGGQVMC